MVRLASMIDLGCMNFVHLNSQVNATTSETTQREAGRRQAKRKETRKEAASAHTTGTNPRPRSLGRCASLYSMCMPLSCRLQHLFVRLDIENATAKQLAELKGLLEPMGKK